MPLDQWPAVLQGIKDKHAITPYVVGPTKGLARSQVFDAVHDYTLAGSIEHMSPAEATAWAEDRYSAIARTSTPANVLCVTVMPGFNDRRASDPLVGRQDGALYAALWFAALALKPDWVLVTTWNEWHEGSEIEASEQYGTAYLDATRVYSERFRRDTSKEVLGETGRKVPPVARNLQTQGASQR